MKTVLLALALLPAVAGVASAADKPWARAQQNRAGLEIDVYPTDGFGPVDATAVGFTPYGQIGVHDNVFIDVELPIGTLFIESADDETVLGNISVGAHYAAEPMSFDDVDLAWWAGGNIAIPTMLASDPSLEQAITSLTVGSTHALVDVHRYLPEALPIRVGGGIELRALDEILYFRSSFAPVLFIPIDGQDSEFFIEQVNELEFRSRIGFGGGIRVQEAFTLTFDDKVQLAMEPFIGYESDAAGVGLIARLGLMMPLDEGLGFAFDEGRMRAVRMNVGARW